MNSSYVSVITNLDYFLDVSWLGGQLHYKPLIEFMLNYDMS